MRAQVQIIQFVLLFLMGLYIFSAIHLFLNIYNKQSQSNAVVTYGRVVGSYIASAYTDLIVYCKFCNYSRLNLTIPRRLIEETYEINLGSFYIRALHSGRMQEIFNHNLNHTYSFSGSVFPEGNVIRVVQEISLPFSVITMFFDRNSRRITIF